VESLDRKEDQVSDTDHLDHHVRLGGGGQERGEAEHRKAAPQKKTAHDTHGRAQADAPAADKWRTMIRV
jgi:hypothetical protein